MKISPNIEKALREAGWPLPEITLEKLIEKCPSEIRDAEGRVHHFMLGARDGGWIATYWKGAFVDTHGPNPKEAVARLWLALPEEERVKC